MGERVGLAGVEALEERGHEPRARLVVGDLALRARRHELGQLRGRVDAAIPLPPDELPRVQGHLQYFASAAASPRTIFTPADAPMRVAPAATIFSTSSFVRTPPEAFTPISGPTVSRMSCTSSTVAPPPAKPVDVFTKSAPAALASVQPMTFSSCVSSAVSR